MVTIATSGDYGKPRPALIIQANVYTEHPSITVLPLTSELHDMPLLRITVEPDKVTTVPRTKVGGQIGRLDATTLAGVGRALAAFLKIE